MWSICINIAVPVLLSTSTDDFKLTKLNPNNFKFFIFCQRLLSNKDAEILGKVLNKLENEPNLTLLQISEDCESLLMNVKIPRTLKKVANH